MLVHFMNIFVLPEPGRKPLNSNRIIINRSGVEGSLSALIRGNGLRVVRYLSQRKRHFQAVFIGCAANIQRVAEWQAGKRPQSRKSGWDLTSAS